MVSKARLRKMRSVSLPSHLTMKRCAVLLTGDWRMEAHKCDVAYADWDADWDTALAKVTKFAGTLPDPDRDFAGDWWVVLEGETERGHAGRDTYDICDQPEAAVGQREPA